VLTSNHLEHSKEVIKEVMHRIIEFARARWGKKSGATVEIIGSQSARGWLQNGMNDFEDNKR